MISGRREFWIDTGLISILTCFILPANSSTGKYLKI